MKIQIMMLLLAVFLVSGIAGCGDTVDAPPKPIEKTEEIPEIKKDFPKIDPPECIEEGGKGIGSPYEVCCEGLTKIKSVSPFSRDPECVDYNGCPLFPTPTECLMFGGSIVCTKCGDGICKDPENICNCPEDCE